MSDLFTTHATPASTPSLTPTVAAIVVTYNRKELLLGCLAALLAQSRPPDRIYVIDNASTDDTPIALKNAGYFSDPRLTIIRLPTNTGGAGGFHHGMRKAHADGHPWLWLMDDDTEPTPTCLAELLSAYDRFPVTRKPVILASKVLWTDQTIHPMNRVAIKQRYGHDDLWMAAELGCLSLRSATFVSLLVHRDAVTRCGLPIAGYFLWNDDVEFTARVLRNGFGAGVPNSIAIHRTSSPYATADAVPERFRLHLRNQLWMFRASPGWDRMERLLGLAMLSLGTMSWLWRQRSAAALGAIFSGVGAGLLHRPPPIELPTA